ncbi:MAG: hypothetical protein H0W61_12075 [Bacteroidetes bacterium]|nr:hypothetical protein [Bacteroidota bacterium]
MNLKSIYTCLTSFCKKTILMYVLINYSQSLYSQQIYDTFEGGSMVHYNLKKGGKMDSAFVNPSKDKVNPSEKCAMYSRSRIRYDNIKMNLQGILSEAEQYATYQGVPKKIKLKIFTSAPVGTLVEIHLGKNTGNAYPEGTHSQYQAFTTVSGKWEELEFKFSQIPPGSKTSPSEINQVTLLFNPYMNTSEIFYFDDLAGPSLNGSKNSNGGK